MSQPESETSGSALVKSLIRHGVGTVFGLPGVQTSALFVYPVVPAPGFLNPPRRCAPRAANAPGLCLTSEVPTPYIDIEPGVGHLHELRNERPAAPGLALIRNPRQRVAGGGY